MIDDVMLEAEDKMDKALQAAKSELASIRTGRANPSMFNGILVDYYGAPTPLQQLASLTIPEARTVLVSPFDRSAMKDIVTAIRESDLGVNPTDDGTVIRVTLPALTEERRLKHLKERADRIAAESGKTSRTPDAVTPPAYKARAAHDDGEIVPSTAAVAASVKNAAGYVANAGMGRTNRRTRRSQ